MERFSAVVFVLFSKVLVKVLVMFGKETAVVAINKTP